MYISLDNDDLAELTVIMRKRGSVGQKDRYREKHLKALCRGATHRSETRGKMTR